jgi:FtsZ-binding cell division protein ZapB
MTKEELEKATGQELIEERDYCGVDGYYGDYLDNVNAEMLKRFNRLAELEKKNADLKEEINKIAFARGNLEEENAELKKSVNNWLKYEKETQYHKSIIKDLKKENAELRKDKKELCHSISEGGKACVYLNEQLTKAKEIIKDLLGSENTSCEEEMFFEIRQKAEQFLNSEVEK